MIRHVKDLPPRRSWVAHLGGWGGWAQRAGESGNLAWRVLFKQRRQIWRTGKCRVNGRRSVILERSARAMGKSRSPLGEGRIPYDSQYGELITSGPCLVLVDGVCVGGPGVIREIGESRLQWIFAIELRRKCGEPGNFGLLGVAV